MSVKQNRGLNIADFSISENEKLSHAGDKENNTNFKVVEKLDSNDKLEARSKLNEASVNAKSNNKKIISYTSTSYSQHGVRTGISTLQSLEGI